MRRAEKKCPSSRPRRTKKFEEEGTSRGKKVKKKRKKKSRFKKGESKYGKELT